MIQLLYFAFALSGAAGLIYEAVWGRYLALFLGHSAYAQVLVIATYLGGMAVGALAVGEGSRRVRAPLIWYALAEGGLALFGLLFHPLFQGLTGLAYSWLIPALGHAGLIGAGKWALAVGMLMPQAVLLGTTFPLISSGFLRRFPLAPGYTLSLLYFTNSLGASVGVLAGGFFLVPWVGLPGALAVAAGLNLAAGGIALHAHRAAAKPAVNDAPLGREQAEGGPTSPVAPSEAGETLWRLLLGVSFFTAVASFAYEIGWIRMLSLVMGSATHSFEVMLSAFILGLALGAFLIRRFADEGLGSLVRLGWIQWFMGLAALGTLPVYLSTFGFMAFLVDFLPKSEEGYLLFNLARYGIAIAVMLPSTIMAGMTLPLITGTLLYAGRGERAIGWVYGVNTLGSVLGVAGAGLLALPVLGLKGMIVAGALLDMSLGVLLLLLSPRSSSARGRWVAAGAVVGMVGAAIGVHLGADFDRRLLISGVFRYGQVPSLEEEPVLFYEDGRTASVGVHLGSSDLLVLSTNGKPDASVSLRWIRAQGEPLPPRSVSFSDEATQSLLGVIPLAHHPRAGTAALIGHGSGLTGHIILGSPFLRRAVTIEIEPEMIQGSQELYPANGRVFDDPRSTFSIDDAKSYFAGRQERFDLIISEPSNPWVSGTSSLFSIEFYRRIQEYLAPGGVFGQWMHLYEMNDSLVTSVLGAIHRSFPRYAVYLVGGSDILVVATGEGTLSPADWNVFTYPGIARTLAHIPPFTPRRLESLFLFDQETMEPVLRDWRPVNSDFSPFLDQGAEKARFLGEVARGYLRFATSRIRLGPTLQEERQGFGEGWEEPVLGFPPLEALSVSAWLRWARTAEVAIEESPSPRHAAALERYRTFSQVMNRGRPPADWRRFSLLSAEVEELVHGATAGVADTLFYAPLFQFLRDQDAPPEARAAADFLLGVAAWDHERASRAAGILLGPAQRGEDWIPRGLLLEGGILARLALGDAEGAREVLNRVENPWGEGGLDIRMELLRALVERGQPGPAPEGEETGAPEARLPQAEPSPPRHGAALAFSWEEERG